MNETPTENQTGGNARPADTKHIPEPTAAAKASTWTALAGVLIIVTLLAAGAALYLAYREKAAAVASRTTLENLVETSETLGTRLEELEEQLEQLRDAQEETSRSLLDLARGLPGSNEDWALAEIEFLLVLATHHLQLERNVDTGLAAMQAAELRLRGLDNPALDPLREQLAQDISRLQALPRPDTGGLSMLLVDLAGRVDKLPFAANTMNRQEVAPQEPASAGNRVPAWRGILDTIWQELRNLVIIKHNADGGRALLLPGQEYFVYENLRLELESARLSLLLGDTGNLHASVAFAQKTIAKYFDTGDAGVKNAMASLQQLSSINLNPAIPDISSSLETLRAYMREKAAEPPPDEENMGPAA